MSQHLTPVRPTWEHWKLDKDFLQSLSRYSQQHPQRRLDRVLDDIVHGLEAFRDLFELIPNNPFPARSLVIALGCLVKLGITISRVKQTCFEFATQVVDWVEQVKSAFEDKTIRDHFNWNTWRSLQKTRDLINEICLWACTRLQDRRWSQITNGLRIGKEVDDFKTRLNESKELFRDLSLIHLTGGMNAILLAIKSFIVRQDAVLKEIQKIKLQQHDQLTYIICELDAKKQAEIRQAFLSDTLGRHVVANATYDQQGKLPCDEGTRVSELAGIMRWLHSISPGSQNFLWLTGDPGSGKSAITASLAEHCLNQPGRVLLTQFFINRNNKETTDPNAYFPTISRHLASKCIEAEHTVFHKLKEQPALALRMTSEQATKIFVDTLVAVARTDGAQVIAVVIDGLDETERTYLRDTAEIFSNLFKSLTRFPNVKVFISSRTEDEIRNPFSRALQDANVKHVHLDTAASFDDVSAYLRKQLAKIVEDFDLNWGVWPGEERMMMLSARASGLFIWAVTAVKYLRERVEEDGQDCLNTVLNELTGEALTGINNLYMLILRLTLKKQLTAWDYEKFRRIIGAIVVLRAPLCLDDLSGLLDLRHGPANTLVDIKHFVRRLRTVLVAGTSAVDGKTILRLHKSFVEFITDAELFKSLSLDCRLCVDPGVVDVELALCCLQLFSKAYQSYSSGSFQYACRFYNSHIKEAEAVIGAVPGLVLRDQAMKVDSISSMFSSIRRKGSPTLWYSAKRRADKSAAFSPLTVAYCVEAGGNATSRLLNTTPKKVGSLTFSPDGKYIISGSEDGSVVLWNVHTGMEMGRFEGHFKRVRAVAFSPSGDIIATGSYDNTVRIWDLETQRLIEVCRGHQSWVISVTFSVDGSILASASHDNTVRLWDARSGNSFASPFRHEASVRSVAFSPEGNYIISGSEDGLVNVWNRHTGYCQQKLESLISDVETVAVSPTGDRLAAIGDGGVCFWEKISDDFVFDDQLSFKIGRSNSFFRIAFSPDGRAVVLWHESDRKPSLLLYDLYSLDKVPFSSTLKINAFTLSPDGSSVAFNNDEEIHISAVPHFPFLTALSPDGDNIACVFSNGAVWLGPSVDLPIVSKRLEGKVGNLKQVIFSSDNSLLAAIDNDSLYFWDTSTLKLFAQGSLTALAPTTTLSFLSDHHTFASFHEDGSIYTWCFEDGSIVSYREKASWLVEMTFDPPLVADADEDAVCERAGAKWYPAKKNEFGLWAYIDGSLVNVKVDGTIIVQPLSSSPTS